MFAINQHKLEYQSIQSLEVLYENDDLIAVNKPHGLLVHRSPIAKDVTEFALQILRNQINQHVYPVHRLDRKTSGVLLFAKSKEVNSEVQQLFEQRKIAKIYQAIVRGYTPENGTIDYALTENNKTQDAITHYKLLKHFETNFSSGKFPTSRYSLIELYPETGRFHQIRKHLAHIRHPIIGDRPHGCNKQNKYWKEEFGMMTMMLVARSLAFEFPTGNHIVINASESEEFKEVWTILKS